MKNEKETILEAIKNTRSIEGRNSMGVSESYYNEYFMVRECFTEEELKAMSLAELKNILKLGEFAAEVFY